jgi:hypothetical protein
VQNNIAAKADCTCSEEEDVKSATNAMSKAYSSRQFRLPRKHNQYPKSYCGENCGEKTIKAPKSLYLLDLLAEAVSTSAQVEFCKALRVVDRVWKHTN